MKIVLISVIILGAFFMSGCDKTTSTLGGAAIGTAAGAGVGYVIGGGGGAVVGGVVGGLGGAAVGHHHGKNK